MEWDGEAVVKTFSADTRERRDRELAVLHHLGGQVPLAEPLPPGDRSSVRMRYVPGILGQEWVASRSDDRVTRHIRLMEQCGATLRRLHGLGRTPLAGRLLGDGPVVVHGDFAPYNMIVDPENGELRAIIDWEMVHFGSRVEDLAWMEWNMRIWYDPQPGVLEALYTAYGSLPSWPERHEAMISRCRPHLERAQRPSFPADVAERWATHMERTCRFREVVF